VPSDNESSPIAFTPTRPAGSAGPTLDVVAIGNALVDVLSVADDGQLERLGLVKGTMALVDGERAAAIYDSLGPTTEASGGSAANTVAGVAALGGRAAFLGRVADDALGRAFTHHIRSIGVAFDPTPVPTGDGASDGASDGAGDEAGDRAGDEGVTGHCLVLVTGDAERTMATHLGVASDFSSTDLDDGRLASSQVVYLEGYLWEQPSAKAAMRRAIELAHDSDALVALTLSDPFCVEHHREEFLELLNGEIDLLFANEDEIVLLFGATDFDDAVDAVAETGVLAALTRGADGSVVVTATGPVAVPAAPVDGGTVVDTTGAGDLFAAGFLYGITNGLTPESSARLGGLCAAEVISHVGARPLADLRAIAVDSGLFA